MAGAVRPASECPRHAHLLLISRPRDAHLPSERPRDGKPPNFNRQVPPLRDFFLLPASPHGQGAPPWGSARARLLRLLGARLAALGGSALPRGGEGQWRVPLGAPPLPQALEPPPKSPIPPPLALQANYAHVKSNLVKEFGALLRKMWSPHNFKGQVSPHELLQATVHMHHATHHATYRAHAPCNVARNVPRHASRHAPRNAGSRARV